VASAQSQEAYAQLLEKSGTAAIESAKKEQQAQFDILAAVDASLSARRKELEEIVNAQRARGTFLTQEQADLDAINAEYDKNAQALYAVNQNILILNDTMKSTEFTAARAAEGFDALSKFLDTGRSAVDDIANVVTGALDSIGDMAQDRRRGRGSVKQDARYRTGRCGQTGRRWYEAIGQPAHYAGGAQ
jgi:chromosome segregation ATPase